MPAKTSNPAPGASTPGASTPGVYTSLADLARLEHRARGFSLLPRQPIYSLLSGRHNSRLRGRGLNFEELRHYRSGDDIRTIDWKATNRTRKPQVRVYTEERDRPSLLVVDQRLSMFFGSQRSLKSVAAAEVAALAAWRTLAQGDRVGGLIFNDEHIDEVRPHRSRRRVLRVLDRIVSQNQALNATTEVDPNPGQLNTALQRVQRLAPHDALILLVTDFSGANEETRDMLTRLTRRNDVMATMVFDPFETRLPEAGPLVFTEQGSQLEVDTSDAKLRDRFASDFEQRIQTIREDLIKRAVPVLPIDASQPVPEQIKQLLGRARTPSRRTRS